MTKLQLAALADPWYPGRLEAIPRAHYDRKRLRARRLVVEPWVNGLVWHAEVQKPSHESNPANIKRLTKAGEEILEGVGDPKTQLVTEGSQWVHLRRLVLPDEMEMLP